MAVKKWYTGLFFLLCANISFAQHKASLDDYLQQGLTNSPLLKDYQNQVQSSYVDSARVRAVYKPQVTGTSLNSYAPVIRGWGYDQAISNGQQVSALVGVNKAIVGPKNLRNQFETIHLQRLGIENAAKISEQDLKRSITAQYITTYGDWQQLSFLTETIAMLQREQLLLKTLTERNVYRQTDYLTFLVTLQQQELAVKQANIQFQSNYATLNYLCGITDTGTVALQEPPVTLATLPSEEHSVFFQQYMLDSLKLVNQRATLDFSYKPRLNVIADAGYNSSLADLPYKNFGTSIGLGLVVPIYDGKQRKLLRNKIAIAEDTRAHYRSFFLKQFNQQIAQLIQQLKATQELISDINTQIRYSDGLIQANRKLLVTGDARIADWVIAINNYLSARNLLTQNTVARWQIINQINYWNR